MIMPWRLTIDINKHVSKAQDCSGEQANAACAQAILDELRLYTLRILSDPKFVHDADEVVGALEALLERLEDLVSFGSDCAQDNINDLLADLYDWGDHYRIWLGLP